MRLGSTMAVALLSLAGSEWGLAGGGPAFVQFRMDGLIGHGGCNDFTGQYTQTGDAVRIRSLALTRKACRPDVMAAERAWIGMLAAVRTVDATHVKLILKDETGAVLATLVRRDWD